MGVKYTLDTKNLKRLQKNHPDQVDKTNGKLAGDMDGHIKANFSRTAPEPSAPGSEPAVQTGKLKQSVTHRRIREMEWETTEGGDNVDYARHLEFGTSRMAARPHFRKAFYAVIKNAPKMLIGTIEDL